jgi:hypothetical protein
MQVLKIKGHTVNFVPTRASHNRYALQYKNKLISVLEKLGTKRDSVEIEFDGFCGRTAKATVLWFFDGHRMYYEVTSQKSYVDNLFVIMKIIENEVNLVLENKKPIGEFLKEFEEDEKVHDERKNAREFFGVEHDHKDIEEINKKYKLLARDLHPDMPNGDIEKFKQLNHHHKILKRELA